MKVEIPAASGDGVYSEFGGNYAVVLTGLWSRLPVMHRRHFSSGRDTTMCGRSVWEQERLIGTWLPFRHAVKFCTPCRRCWP